MSEPNLSLRNDLPPRTWRSWWLARPKWFRIGCWAAGVMIVLHVALALRICLGLIESQAIRSLKEGRSVSIRYSWENEERFSGEHLLLAGLLGRSCDHVTDVRIYKGSDAELKLIADNFPNLRSLDFPSAEVTPAGLASLSR